MNSMTVPGGSKAHAICLRVGGGQLLPGIPNDITLDQIAPKLPWTTFYVLSLVSPAWRHAFQSRQVYDARVRSDSTETLVLLKYAPSEGEFSIALFSNRNNVHKKLPPVPYLDKGIPADCQYVSLHGKLYVLGGYSGGRCSVYVLDLAGPKWKWIKCASMQEREDFVCGAINGKIYVFGGTLNLKPVGSEVYDPDENAWSPIKPIPPLRYNHCVLEFGEELLVHPGKICGPNYLELNDRIPGCNVYTEDRLALEAYHPIKDEWRVVGQFPRSPQKLFMFQERLHGINPFMVDVYDSERKSWTRLQSSSKIGHLCDWPGACTIHAILAVNDELLGVFFWCLPDVGWDENDPYNRVSWVKYLLRGRGLGSENEEIVWQKVERSPPFEHWPIQEGKYPYYPPFGIQPIRL